MNYTRITPLLRLQRLAAGLFALLALAATAASAADGTIIGNVTSAGTRNALQGAVVSLPALGRTVLTDNAGHFTIPNVPAGVVDLVVTYSDFEDANQKVSVGAGASANVDVAMKATNLVTMEAFTVATVREGQALSVTEQRNASNVKNVVALDEWGVLPTLNVGELFTRLPGISFTTDEDDLINNVTVRGLVASNGQSFTRLNIDGMSSTGVGGNGRTATLHSFSAALYEQLEVISGQTPDRRADGLGGQINLKTRSPLAMNEKRRFNYSLSGRYNPSSSKRNQDIADHPYGYAASLGYTEVFDILGGQKNLGLTLSVVQQQVMGQFDWDFLQYQNVIDDSAAYFRDYDKRSGSNHRFITGYSFRADYRVSPSTTVSARFQYNGGSEPFFHYTFVNPFHSTTPSIYNPTTNPNGGIIAGSNSTRSEIRAIGNSQMLLTPRRWSFTSNNPTGTVVIEHNFGRLKIDHAWRMSRTHWDANSGRQSEGGQLSIRTRNPIAFILDNSNLDGRVFTQTAASAATDSVYNPASYTSFVVSAANTTSIPVAQTSVFLTKRSTTTDTNEWSGTINASYDLPTERPITLKAGFDTVNRKVDNFQSDPRRWYLISGQTLDNLPLMPLTTFEKNHGGQRLPVFDPIAVARTLGDATKWYEDVNYNATQKLTSSRHMKDMVDAGYFQAQTRWGPLTLLGGVRFEKPKTTIWTYFRARTNLIATQPDPYKRAEMDYNRLGDKGRPPTKKFPSVHAAYDITPNIKARASWSTSYNRPDMLQLVPGVTANDTLQTVTIGNPDLRPMMAKNLDVKLEYYTKNSGLISLGAYERRITDYIPSGLNYSAGGDTVPAGPDNGFDGLYGGYQIISPKNIGAIKLQGLEIDFKQRLAFLPGALKGLTARFNYTWLAATGNLFFSAAQTVPTSRKTREIPGMMPRSGNLGLQYAYGRFGASFDVNYTGEYPAAVVATLGTQPNFTQLIAYRKSLTRLNAGATYRVNSYATVFLNASNLGETGPNIYTSNTTRPRTHNVSLMSVSFGVTGQF